MSRISTEEAFLMLGKWSEERAPIQFVMSRPIKQRSASPAIVNEVLPQTQRALLTLREESGEEVDVTVSLEGAEWEYEDAGVVVPEFFEQNWVCFLAANFVNGNRYVFAERVKRERDGDDYTKR
jgi:hypothetical protein